MDTNPLNPENPGMASNAVSLYSSGGASEEFPVLKAFQQYIDAEQAKARKRLISMGVFFGILTLSVIAVFVTLLLFANRRNQTLNDKMLEFVLQDRDRKPDSIQTRQPVQPQQPESAEMIALKSKLEELQRNVVETQHKAEKAEIERKAAEELAKVRLDAELAKAKSEAEAEQSKARIQAELDKANAAKAAAEAALVQAKALTATRKDEHKSDASAAQSPSTHEIELKKLQTQLALEKQKNENEAARRKEAELEIYRRKHYPELYQTPVQPVLIPAVPVEAETCETSDVIPQTVTPKQTVRKSSTTNKPSTSKSSRPPSSSSKQPAKIPVLISPDDVNSMKPLISYPEAKPAETRQTSKPTKDTSSANSKSEMKTPTTLKVNGSALEWQIPER